ncbi:energy-coupling factor ABC transporter permease [Caldicellulosiruptor changbaiensis]|uniref:energy-coupling factor ABC transporter permease n=1 Tax=Caldicellulosiruptor changbaiensis TaxID=1222016 RepID=UPI001F4988A0|nr:energy-coupling factor ABC transporter permease [Caldicellulosiruptor changbaiensis]
MNLHIPDGYLSPQTCATFYAVSAAAVGYAFNKFRKQADEKTYIQLSVASAFTFIVMMFNFPVVGGSSAHITGIPLITFLFGPMASTVASSVVLIIQALLFRDGGILALGTNIFNMAVAIPLTAVLISKLLEKLGLKNEKVRIFISSYFSINFAALLTAFELGLQPLLFTKAGKPLYFMYDLKTTIPAMMIPHILVVAVVEAVLTVLLYSPLKNFATIKAEEKRGE